MLRDTFDLCKRLERRTFPPNNLILIKADIKEFFMSGRHSEILESCSKHVCEQHRASFREMAGWILGSQFVSLPFDSGQLYHVEHGSGMGLSCSGDLSDCTFWDRAEKEFIDSTTVRTKHSIWEYYRFYDDILIIADKRGDWKSFVAELSRRAGVFEVVVESASDVSAQMLDIRIFFGERYKRTKKLDTISSPKATNISVPLLPTSDHAAPIHRSWPIAMLKRCSDISSDRRGFQEQAALLRARWQKFGVIYSKPDSQATQRQGRISRVILPFSKAWAAAGLPKLLTSFESRLAREAPDTNGLGIAWALGGVHLISRLRGPSVELEPQKPTKIKT